MKIKRKLLKKIVENEMICYTFFGGCTTVFNLGVFSLLRYGVDWSVREANLSSILLAIVFAFSVNKRFVFQSVGKNAVREFAEFTGMRFLTMAVEFFGVDFLVYRGNLSSLASKLLIQVVVFVLNYLISKFIVFSRKLTSGGIVNG